MIKEKRKERRKSPRVKGGFSMEIAHQKSKIVADTINISTCGIYCQSDHSIPLFREIGIKVRIPGMSKEVECSGVIVRCEKVPGRERYNLAIFFSDLPQEDKDSLTGYVEKSLARTAK